MRLGDKPAKGKAAKRPWRDNLEAVTMAIIVAVMLKYFIVEAYKIPTGSMQPTLMGNAGTGIFDRILVDKLSYHYRAPERFEVAVFKYPLDRSMNYIKRIAGVGPEWLRIHNGDLWRSDRPKDDPPRYETDWTTIRRPANVQADTWKPLYPGAAGCPQWLRIGDASSWELEEGRIAAHGDGSLRLPSSGSFRDNFKDGYPYTVRNALRPRPGVPSSENLVGDLRFEAEVTATAECEVIQFGLREGSRLYTFTLPGPAAAAGETASILAKDLSRSARSPLSRDIEVKCEEGWRLEADASLEVAVENLDDRLTLEVDGEELLTIDIPAATDQASQINVQVVGGGVIFDDVEVFRDIYYLSENATTSKWFVDEDHYIMLGDNTQDSSDSREWSLARYEWEVDGEVSVFEGNYRRVPPSAVGPERYSGNPVSNPDGTTFFFRDKWGSRHAIPNSERSNAQPATRLSSQVPKELIVGRALVVFWPLKPSLKLWRLKWIR